MPKPVSIIVLCHNQWAATRRCLAALRQSTPSDDYELLVYDNASTDSTSVGLRRLARRWPQLRVFRNNRNLPFSEGVNRGMRAAEGRYFLWLNNDTIVAPGWLEGLLKAAQSGGAGGVGPMTDNMAPPQQICRTFKTRRAGRVEEAPFLGGFCFLLKREAAQRAGFLDERFVWGWEDMDYCMRLRQAGERLLLARDVFVRHAGSGTLDAVRSSLRKRMDLRNRQLMMRKWMRAEPWRSDFLNLYVRMPSYWKETLPLQEFKSFVSIVVLCRGNWRATRLCLDSVRRCPGDTPYEVLASCVGSDARTASGLNAAAKKWPQLRVIGFWGSSHHSHGINLSVRAARGDSIVILSDDVVVTPGWIERLVGGTKTGKNVGGVAPVCKGAGLAWQQWHPDRHSAAVMKSVRYVNGHCLLIPRGVLSRIGDFDDRFRRNLWVEDFCYRAVHRGYRILVAGGAVVRRLPTHSAPSSPHDRRLMFHKWSNHSLLPDR